MFDRGGEKVSYEITRDGKGHGFMLVLTSSNGQKRVEHVDQPSALIERSVEQMRRLKDDGWNVG